MTYGFGFMIESLVAVLLMLTIAYCVILNNRLKRLRADEQSLKATIGELITATEIAERAVAGLKTTAHECDQTLGERLRAADRSCLHLNARIKAGDALMERLSRIVAAGQPGEGPMPIAAPAASPAPVAVATPAPTAPAETASAEMASAQMTSAAPALTAPAPRQPARVTPGVAPDPRAVAAAAQAFAERARTRLNALAA